MHTSLILLPSFTVASAPLTPPTKWMHRVDVIGIGVDVIGIVVDVIGIGVDVEVTLVYSCSDTSTGLCVRGAAPVEDRQQRSSSTDPVHQSMDRFVRSFSSTLHTTIGPALSRPRPQGCHTKPPSY
eukprot:325398-Pyramimonas_sp.AAC.1